MVDGRLSDGFHRLLPGRSILLLKAIAGGVDEVDFDRLTTEEIRQQWKSAREQAGSKYIITPGCSVPDASTDAELARMPRAIGV